MSTEAAEMSAVRAASTALLLMDFQNDIVALIADGDALVQRAAEARAWADANGVQVVHVRVAFRPEDYMEISPNNKRFGPRRGGGTMADETPGTAVHSALAPTEQDVVVRKTRVGAFSTTDLAQELADRSIDTLILAGISTSGVVLSTIRDAADHDYRLFVLADCCADPEAEVHDVLVGQVFPKQADMIDLASLPGLLARD